MVPLRSRNVVHKISIIKLNATKEKEMKDHGVVMSYEDSEGIKVADQLVIHKTIKLAEIREFDGSSTPYFYLRNAKEHKDSNDNNKNLIEYLRKNTSYAAFIYLDSKGTVGLLTAIPLEERAMLDGDRFYAAAAKGNGYKRQRTGEAVHAATVHRSHVR